MFYIEYMNKFKLIKEKLKKALKSIGVTDKKSKALLGESIKEDFEHFREGVGDTLLDKALEELKADEYIINYISLEIHENSFHYNYIIFIYDIKRTADSRFH